MHVRAGGIAQAAQQIGGVFTVNVNAVSVVHFRVVSNQRVQYRGVRAHAVVVFK